MIDATFLTSGVLVYALHMANQLRAPLHPSVWGRMSAQRHGGIWFIRLGRINVSVSLSRERG